MACRSLTTGYLWPRNTTDVVATSAVTPKHPPTARNCHGNPFARNDLRAVRIRGVRPRGLIEARAVTNQRFHEWEASAGYAPAASLKHDGRGLGAVRRGRIRGVRPRGLIEA